MSRVKHLFAVVLAALMLCLLMPVAAFAEEASDGKMIVYAKLPSDWSDPHLWAWADDGTNAFDAWPGVPGTLSHSLRPGSFPYLTYFFIIFPL